MAAALSFLNSNYGIKNAPSALLSYLLKHLGIFQNTREVLRKERAVGVCFPHFFSVLENSEVLI